MMRLVSAAEAVAGIDSGATPQDAHGFCSLGVSVEAMHAAIRAARTVIVQFNSAMPRTLGESFIHVNDIDPAVEVGVPPFDDPPAAQPAGCSPRPEGPRATTGSTVREVVDALHGNDYASVAAVAVTDGERLA